MVVDKAHGDLVQQRSVVLAAGNGAGGEGPGWGPHPEPGGRRHRAGASKGRDGSPVDPGG